jgi:hypothetical protein
VNVVHFPKSETLVRALSAGVVPDALADSFVQFGVDEKGGYWIQPASPLGKSIATAIAKLGGAIHSRSTIELRESASRWAEVLPLEAATEGTVDKALLEWTRFDQIPTWTALLRRLGGSVKGWRTEPHRALALVTPAPFHALAQPLPPGWSAFVEQVPGFWVEYGFQHPVPIRCNDDAQVIARRAQPWESIQPLGKLQRPKRFSILTVDQGTTSPHVARIPISPRLVSDTRSQSPTLWVLPADGDSTLREWLQNTDDRLLRHLQAARVETPIGSRVILLTQSDADRGPLILVNATSYYSYLKLNNLFLPVGRRMSPGLRRDVARRAYAPHADRLVWLDQDDQGKLMSTAVPFSAFRPLAEIVRYQTSATVNHIIDEPHPLFLVQPLVIKDRPASKTRPKIVATTARQSAADGESSPGLINSLIAWVKGTWQITVATPPTTVASAHLAAAESPRMPLPEAPPPTRWHEQTEQVRALVRQGQQPSSDAWADLARAAMRERRFAEAAWCWQQIIWSGDASAVAATGWVQCENLSVGGQTAPEDWSVGQLAAQIVRSMILNQPMGQPADLMLQRIAASEGRLPIRAVWMAHRALAQRAGNDVLTLARVRDRLLSRLYCEGLNLELDVPAFLRAEDGHQSDRLTVVRSWLERLPDVLARWLGERPTPPDRLEEFGLARERINTKEYAHLITGWGLTVVGATARAQELATPAMNRLINLGPVHAWLADAFRHRLAMAHQHHRTTGRWPEPLELRWRQLPFAQRFAIDRMQQASRILDPMRIVDPFVAAQHGLDHPLVQLPLVEGSELPRAVENILQRTRPTSAARLPVLTLALKIAPRAGESLGRWLLDQLLLELEPFHATSAQWQGLQAGLIASVSIQEGEWAQRLLSLWLEWIRETDQLPAELADTFLLAIAALRRTGWDAHVQKLTAEMQRLLAAPAREARSTIVVDQTRIAVAGGLFSLGRDDAALRILDDIRRMLFTQSELEPRDRLALALRYVESLSFASARVAVGRMDELLQRMPVPADQFSTNAYFALAPLQFIEAIVRAAANEDTAMGSQVRRWLDAEELAIRRRILADVAAIIGET